MIPTFSTWRQQSYTTQAAYVLEARSSPTRRGQLHRRQHRLAAHAGRRIGGADPRSLDVLRLGPALDAAEREGC
jgi:hypothetical protein